MRFGLLTVFLGCLLTATGTAQSRRPAAGTQTLAAAERTLIDALKRRDQAAFRKLLATDTVFFYPTMSEGPEAIVKMWLPFLVEAGPTMVITSEGVRISDANAGSSGGSFAIEGETDEEFDTIHAGTLTVSWRRVGGAWKIRALDAAGPGGVRVAPPGSVGTYHFGMSREQVAKVADCKPYTKVAQTGGLDCQYYRFDGHPMPISFLFNAGGLSRIQLGFYEGDSENGAREATGRVIHHIIRKTGGVSIEGVAEGQVTPDTVMEMLRQPVKAGRAARVEISGLDGPASEVWSAHVVRYQVGYHVLLFASRR